MAFSRAALATSYQITDLGAFPQNHYIIDSNDFGQLIAVSSDHTGFIWTPGQGISYLPVLEGYQSSVPQAINNKGQIVGYSYSDPSNWRACLWEEGKPVQDLGAFPSGEFTPGSYAYDINESEQVVGSSISAEGNGRPCLWSSSGGMEALTLPDQATWGGAIAINDDGLVVGKYGTRDYSRIFLWSRAHGMLDLTQYMPSADRVVGINNSGSVLLVNVTTEGVPDAFVWNEATGVHIIGSLPRTGYRYADPHDLNNLGQVVGKSSDQAFIWDDLNGTQPLPMPNSHWYVSADTINDSGQIAGCFADSAGFHLILWTPTPEPSSLLAMLGGISCVVGLWKRSRIR